MSAIAYLTDYVAIEDFNVDTVANGYSISSCGLKFDPDNDWDENPTEYHSVQVVTQDKEELLEVLNYLGNLPHAKQYKD